MGGFSKCAIFLRISRETSQDFQATIYLSEVSTHTAQKLWKFWAPSPAIFKRQHSGIFAMEGAFRVKAVCTHSTHLGAAARWQLTVRSDPLLFGGHSKGLTGKSP